jgi:hypothetical protein
MYAVVLVCNILEELPIYCTHHALTIEPSKGTREASMGTHCTRIQKLILGSYWLLALLMTTCGMRGVYGRSV